MNCPLISKPIESKHHHFSMAWTDCIEDKCRWWTGENCIVFDVANGLKDLAGKILDASRMLRPPIGRQSEESRPETPQPKTEGGIR